MGGIFSKLCCLPKNPKGPLKKRISSLIIERSSSTQVQSIKIEEEESPELKRYKRILEKDFEVEIDLLCDNNFEGIEFKSFQLKHRQSNRKFTLTRYPKQNLLSDFSKRLCNEIELLATALPHHPYLINLYWSWQDEDFLYRIDDFSSFSSSGSSSGNDLRVSREMVCKLIVAIHYIHSYGLVHGNINPHTSIILGSLSNQEVRISGFNHLRRLKGGRRLVGVVGDFEEFRAPECGSEGGDGYFEEIDWYSVGKCLQFWKKSGVLTTYGTAIGTDDTYGIANDTAIDTAISTTAGTTSLDDLIEKLTVERSEERLGYGPAAFKSIQSHAYFSKINWQLLTLLPHPAPPSNLTHLKTSIDSLKSASSVGSVGSLNEFLEFSWVETGEIGEMLENYLNKHIRI